MRRSTFFAGLFVAALAATMAAPVAVGADGFIAVGSMRNERTSFAAAMLPDGSVLVSGGYSGIRSAEVYQPATRTFSSVGDMAAGRQGHTATTLLDGRVLITGGINDSVGTVSSAELFSPSTNSFSPAGNMIRRRGGHTATLLSDGTVLIMGGSDNGLPLASVERYDALTGTFSLAGNMRGEHSGHDATRLRDGKVLITGDFWDAAELYDPATATSSFVCCFRFRQDRSTATLLSDGRVLIAGGFSGVTGTESMATLYDPVSNTLSSTGRMTRPHTRHSAALLPSGKVLITGGLDDFLRQSAELYDPASGTFTTTANMTVGRTDHNSLGLLDGSVLVVGGFDHNGTTLRSAELYASVQDTTAPQISLTRTPAANSAGWNSSPVTVDWSVADPESGVSTSSGCADVVIAAETAGLTMTCTATNGAGLSASLSTTVRIDTTPPVVNATRVTPANEYGWNNTDVVIHFDATDALSGIAGSAALDAAVTVEGADQTASATFSDIAGNTTAATATGINIDRTPPAVAYDAHPTTYDITETLAITANVSDALSGIATTAGTQSVTGPAYTLGLGTHTVSVTVTDRAGNSRTATTSFTIVETYDSLCSLTRSLSNSSSIADSLCEKLAAARAAHERGNSNATNGVLAAYRNQLSAQKGKAFDAVAAQVLAELTYGL